MSHVSSDGAIASSSADQLCPTENSPVSQPPTPLGGCAVKTRSKRTHRKVKAAPQPMPESHTTQKTKQKQLFDDQERMSGESWMELGLVNLYEESSELSISTQDPGSADHQAMVGRFEGSTSKAASQDEVEGGLSKRGRKKAKVKEKSHKSEAPDHFIALQITNPKIHSSFEDIQEIIVYRSPAMKDAMVSVRKLHITVMPMCLPTEDHIARAKAALDLCADRLQTDYSDGLMVLDVAGIAHFRNNVLFAKVLPSDPNQPNLLQHISDVVHSSFAENEIKNTDKRKAFSPHITIAKLSKNFPKLKKKGITKIDPSLYEDLVDRHLGREVVTSLQLCSMFKKNELTGYYKILHQASFGPRKISQLSINELTSTSAADVLVQWSMKSAMDELRTMSCVASDTTEVKPHVDTGETLPSGDNTVDGVRLGTGGSNTELHTEAETIVNVHAHSEATTCANSELQIAKSDVKIATNADSEVKIAVDSELEIDMNVDSDVKTATDADSEVKIATDANVNIATDADSSVKIAVDAEFDKKIMTDADSEMKRPTDADSDVK